MKKFKQINNLMIMEKKESEIPTGIDLERKYLVEAPDGRVLEDNLLESEAVEFCKETTDFLKAKTGGLSDGMEATTSRKILSIY